MIVIQSKVTEKTEQQLKKTVLDLFFFAFVLLSFPISFCVSYDSRSTLSRLKVSRTHLLEAVRFRALERRKKGKEKAVRTEETGAQQSHLLRLYAVLQYAQRISAALRA